MHLVGKRMGLFRFGRGSARRRRRAQSLVEFAIILPILLIMISGVIELGFMLNYYLDLIDAARDIARFAATIDPLLPDDPNPAQRTCADTQYFYRLIACMMPTAGVVVSPTPLQEQIVLNPLTDDVVVSAFGITDNRVRYRLPDADGWSWKDWLFGGGANRGSSFSNADIEAMLDAGNPARGAVLVEIYYNYHMVLALPWITAFVPNPVTLHAYTIMPNTFVEPTRTPWQ